MASRTHTHKQTHNNCLYFFGARVKFIAEGAIWWWWTMRNNETTRLSCHVQDNVVRAEWLPSCVFVCVCWMLVCNNNGRLFFVWILHFIFRCISKLSAANKAVDPMFSSDYDAAYQQNEIIQRVTGNVMSVCCNLLSQCKTIKPRNGKVLCIYY